MPRCGCEGAVCSCSVVPGPGIDVEGHGTPSEPYRISATTGDISQALTVQTTPTLHLDLVGEGTPVEPLVISGYPTMTMKDLLDVHDPEGAATNGQVPTWVTDHWEFLTPVVPPGTVKASNGIGGDGSVATPLTLLNSNTWGQGNLAKSGNDSLAGRGMYIDSAGQVRTRPLELDAVQGASFTANSTPSDWPVGRTSLQVTGATAATWPGAVSGVVETLRRAGEVDPQAADQQWFYATTATLANYAIWYRSGAGNPSTWGPWVRIFGDSGWVNITVNSGFAVQGSDTPQVRLLNGIVFVKGGWNTTGITASANFVIGNIPAGYRPQVTMHFPWGNGSNVSTALAMALVSPSGDITLRAGSTLPSYYEFGGQSWPAYA